LPNANGDEEKEDREYRTDSSYADAGYKDHDGTHQQNHLFLV
jgi:hypothetical protein